MCAFHRWIHLQNITVTMNRRRQVTLVFPAGDNVDRPIDTIPYEPTPPADPNLITGHWNGEPLQLHYAVNCLCN
jgi:hypothetical protein